MHVGSGGALSVWKIEGKLIYIEGKQIFRLGRHALAPIHHSFFCLMRMDTLHEMGASVPTCL